MECVGIKNLRSISYQSIQFEQVCNYLSAMTEFHIVVILRKLSLATTQQPNTDTNYNYKATLTTSAR